MKVVLTAAIYTLPVMASVRPWADWDLWWHLRVGEWIVQNGQVPQNDPFSVWGSQHSWIAYSWLFELLVHGLYQWHGLTAIVVFRVVLAVAVVGSLHFLVARREPRFLVRTTLALLAALAISPLCSERPWLFTILFTALTLNVVLELREGRRSVLFWLLPLAYVLWANLHIQFLYGLLILGLGCGAPLVDHLFRVRRERTGADVLGSAAWKQLVGLTVVCVLATLVNPYGVRLYAVVVDYATQPVAFQVISELTAMSFREPWAWITLALTLIAVFALGRSGVRSSFEPLLLIGAVALCFRTRRDTWTVVLAALVILPPAIPGRRDGEPQRLGWVGAAAAALLVLGWGLFLGVALRLTPERLRESMEERFPVRAAMAVEERGYTGPIYNHFDWGGYLIWRLPHLQVTMDGRTNLHTDARLKRSLRTWAGEKGWDEDPELWEAGFVFADARAPLTSLLKLDREHFEKVYEDDQAAIFLPKRARK